MIIPLGLVFILIGVIVVVGLVVYVVILNRTQTADQPLRRVNKTATISMVFGLFSFIPSICWLSIITGANRGIWGDFQGGGMIFIFLFWVMAPVGLMSVITGVSALVNIYRNRMTETGYIQAIAGIILGLPGAINSLFFLYSRLP